MSAGHPSPLLEEEIAEKLSLQSNVASASTSDHNEGTSDAQIRMTCFSEEAHDAILHFQIISFSKQVYIWIGCNSAKLGYLHAGAFTRPNMNPTVTTLIGGGADSTGAGIARRLVSRTGLNIIVACNIPKDSPMLEALAERLLIQKLNCLGYSKCDKKKPNEMSA
eukprot:TRINITY_DN5891_c0_g1_i1.p1 TRINITY_DN5891_c0_g1~~TRINITY_DN5891_c0_g1_i1.p1  ORF type:complete len:165 (+),score=31.86 TRINITY_DN5891_c0_g1_i1:186-680(+)